MATFITNINFTQQGIKGIDETTKRAAALKVSAKKMGVKVTDVYWTLGDCDGVLIFQAPDDVADPNLSMLVGSFRLEAKKHLQRGETLREGQAINIDWTMSDNGLLDAKVEIPELSFVFDMGKIFSPKAGHKNFDGEDGAELADGLLDDAGSAVEDVGDVLGETAWADVQKLKQRVEAQRTAVSSSLIRLSSRGRETAPISSSSSFPDL